MESRVGRAGGVLNFMLTSTSENSVTANFGKHGFALVLCQGWSGGHKAPFGQPLSSLGLPETAEAMIYGAMGRLMLRRLA